MEVVELSGSSGPIPADFGKGDNLALDRVRIKRKTLQTVLEQCQRALESLSAVEDADADSLAGSEADDGEVSSEMVADREADELCDLLQSRIECPDFLEKLESVHQSVPQNMSEEGSSWDMISKSDIWDDGNTDLEHDDYFLVSQEDIVDSIACFMAAYLLSLKETKELTPNQLQDALSKTFSVKKKKGKLRKAWDGSKVIYNVVSWGATAVGIYQNPAIVRVASDAFCASCRVISKLL